MSSPIVSNPHDKSDYSFECDIRRLLTTIKKRSPTSKIIVGSTCGWVAGLLVARVGKLVALSLGGAIILLQIAREKNFVKVNWEQVDGSMKKAPNALSEGSIRTLSKKITAAANFDSVLSSGFLGGFLIGLSTD